MSVCVQLVAERNASLPDLSLGRDSVSIPKISSRRKENREKNTFQRIYQPKIRNARVISNPMSTITTAFRISPSTIIVNKLRRQVHTHSD